MYFPFHHCQLVMDGYVNIAQLLKLSSTLNVENAENEWECFFKSIVCKTGIHLKDCQHTRKISRVLHTEQIFLTERYISSHSKHPRFAWCFVLQHNRLCSRNTCFSFKWLEQQLVKAAATSHYFHFFGGSDADDDGLVGACDCDCVIDHSDRYSAVYSAVGVIHRRTWHDTHTVVLFHVLEVF